MMERLRRLHSVEGEYFQYRRSAKLLSELLIVLSVFIGVSTIGTLVLLGSQLDNSEEELIDEDSSQNKNITFALFMYTIIILIVCISDAVFALMLRSGIQKLKLSYCLFWRGATITSLIVTGMITLSFITMVHDLIVLLGYLPSIISKPFCLWIINGFILELGELRTLPFDFTIAAHPPAKPTFSLSDTAAMKNSTTVFDLNKGRKHGAPYVVAARLKSIPE